MYGMGKYKEWGLIYGNGLVCGMSPGIYEGILGPHALGTLLITHTEHANM